MFRPTDSFHSSPYPHFECLQSCYVHLSHCPCLCAVKGYAPNQRFNHSFLEASFQSSPQELFPLYESFFSHCNPSPDFSVTFGIISDQTSQVTELFYLFYSLSFNYYHHSCFLSIFFAYLHHFCLFSVYFHVVFCRNSIQSIQHSLQVILVLYIDIYIVLLVVSEAYARGVLGGLALRRNFFWRYIEKNWIRV